MNYQRNAIFAIALLGLLVLSACATTDENVAGDAKFAAEQRQVRAASCDADTACEMNGLTLNGPDTSTMTGELREGETQTYTVGGVDFEINLVSVVEPTPGRSEAKFSVNGFITPSLKEGEGTSLPSDGGQITVTAIKTTEREGIVAFTLQNGGNGMYACFDSNGALYKSSMPCNRLG